MPIYFILDFIFNYFDIKAMLIDKSEVSKLGPGEFSSNLPQHICREVSNVSKLCLVKSLISWFRCV